MRELLRIVFDIKGKEVVPANTGTLCGKIMNSFSVVEFRLTRNECIAFVLACDDAEEKTRAIDAWWNRGEPLIHHPS